MDLKESWENAPYCEGCGAKLHPYSSQACVCKNNGDDWKRYGRKGFTEMRPYIEGEELPPSVSISKADLSQGCPKVGDMIARNSEDHSDQWLVNETFFKENYYTG